MPILGVDHGEKRIGVATSDFTDTLARPLKIIRHESRAADARRILELAEQLQATTIVVGHSRDEEGRPNVAGRRADRFAEQLRSMTQLSVILWDESLSTQDARKWRLASGASRKKRASRVDAVAAAIILQSYLDALPRSESTSQDMD